MKLVIDADQMIFACGFAAENEPLSHALHLVNQKIESLVKATEAYEVAIYVKGEGNFRDEISPTYKATRNTRKPKHYDGIYEYLLRAGAIPCSGMEADDAVSLELWKDYEKQRPEEAEESCSIVCYSADKDLLNTPGWHINLKSDEPFWVSEQDALKHFVKQLLMGDRVDNIQGIPCVPKEFANKLNLRGTKVGPKNAEKILEAINWDLDSDLILGAIKSLYSTVHSTDYFYDTADLLWMSREIGEEGFPIRFSDARRCADGWILEETVFSNPRYVFPVIKSLGEFGLGLHIEYGTTREEDEASAQRSEEYKEHKAQRAIERLSAMRGDDSTGGGGS